MITKYDRLKRYDRLLVKPIGVQALESVGFFTAPASRARHGAYEGGLFDHSYAVMDTLLRYTTKLNLKWSRPESPYIVGLFHDFCKCGLYRPTEDGDGYLFNETLIVPGHGERSVIMLQKYIDLTDEEIACIRWHMGAFETDTKLWACYGAAVTEYPNVLYTHTADMFASKILGV